MNPRFSVIIPAFNAAATLSRAIESVRAQSWPAHEIIVVDDGSTDATVEIARQYGDVVRLVQQDNSGVSVARNAGAAVATGDWLAFLDADDWYAVDRIKLHAERITQDVALNFLTGDYEYRDEADGLLGTSMAQHESGRMLLAKAKGEPYVVMESSVEIAAFVADHFGDTHTLSVPRARFVELGGYPTGFKVCEDVHFLTRLVAKSERIGVICKSLGVYVIHGGSATRRHPIAAQRENVRTLKDLVRLAENFPFPVRQGVAVRMQGARYNLGCALNKSGQRVAAINAVLPSLAGRPGWKSLRNVLSMLKG
ncbi:MAG: glycosyltransferase family 2 protein [Sulfuriferula multivorans]|uniref:Glycosyltransferase family 2 protein n=1 Tax=Sulfuriferula multivorans TaxID=1559896 RepID=A0A7C9P8D7_9PROT|nr:glycosyltransferase family 2 protein [Sulfuriferula multivorans]